MKTDSGVRELMNMFRASSGQAATNGDGAKEKDKDPVVPQAPAPLLATTMDKKKTFDALPVLGISLERKEVQSLVQSLPMPWKEWWAFVCKLKSVSQWQSKLHYFNEDDKGYWIQDAKTYPQIGSKLFQHLDSEGEWSQVAIQDPPP